MMYSINLNSRIRVTSTDTVWNMTYFSEAWLPCCPWHLDSDLGMGLRYEVSQNHSVGRKR